MEKAFARDLIEFGGAFLRSKLFSAADQELGFPSSATAQRGWAAPLGNLSADELWQIPNVQIFAKRKIASLLAATSDWSVEEAAIKYRKIAAEWARQYLLEPTIATEDEVNSATAAMGRVVAAAEAPQKSIFGSWRSYPQDAMVQSENLLWRTIENLHWNIVQLRELRGLRHFEALATLGLPPSVAVVANPREDGVRWMILAGFTEAEIQRVLDAARAFPGARKRWHEAEKLTEDAFEADLSILDSQARSVTAQVISQARQSLDVRRARRQHLIASRPG